MNMKVKIIVSNYGNIIFVTAQIKINEGVEINEN